MLTKRYAEAAHNYELLDRFLREGGYKATLENFGRYMLPKFRANYLAGNNDTALYIANMVAEYYDSALIQQKIIDADLLTTVYDTEGKERQIAEQNARLSNQRLIMLAIVTVIIVVFFHIYMIQRRRAYKKLDAANRELILANERAEESARMKTKFIQQISHEVRTPLNVLSGFTQVLAAPDIEISSEELQSISHKIVENSERITHLVDKMLDLSQINKNTFIECNDTVKPADIVAQAVKTSGILQASHLKFEQHISPEAEALTFTTNQKAAAKALTLLLDNAIKFTHPLAFKGSQTAVSCQRVSLSVSTTDQQIMFTVEDTGIGIPPEQAENIFKEFVQLDEYSDGTGIGLSIARSLARQLHGDVILDTTYTAGARFVMTILF
jgi:signal transduction histidine kinase